MNKILRFLTLSILGLVVFTQVKASHQAAVDIYYEYISPLKYKVHLVIYRDCTGIGQGGSESMTA